MTTIESTGTHTSDQDHLFDIANNTLSSFDNIVEAARSRLDRGGLDATTLAAHNSFTGVQAQNRVIEIGESQLQEMERLCEEPAIARLLLRDEEGNEKVYFISRDASLPQSSGCEVISYRAPIGRLASLPVGSEEEVRTPKGARAYEVIEKAVLRPALKNSLWDSIDSVVHWLGHGPVTVRSFRELLETATPSETGELLAKPDLLAEFLEKERRAALVLDGIQRSVRIKMGLRDQSILDQYQDEISRLKIDSRLVILGPPGTGKTTTLIKRLGQKLDTRHLDDDEARLIAQTDAKVAGHPQSWLMFTPTELLKQYVKEAFNLEDIAASDQRIFTWSDFRRALARNSLGILRNSTGSGFVLKTGLEVLQPTKSDTLVELYLDFNDWQEDQFWSELNSHSNRLAQNGNPEIARIGTQLQGTVNKLTSDTAAARFLAISDHTPQLQSLIETLKAETEQTLREAFSRELKRDPALLEQLAQFVGTLKDTADDPEEEAEEEEDFRPIRATAFDAYTKAMRDLARGEVNKRAISRQSRNGKIVEWLGDRAMPADELRPVGEKLQTLAAVRRFLTPLRRYLGGMSSRYRRFRRERQGEGRWYRADGFSPADITALELDTIVLATLRAARRLLEDGRIKRGIDEPRYATLKSIKDLYRNQIVVDEATDFSPVQLACMAALCAPSLQSFLACGDFNQRITTWGSRSAADLKFVFPDIQIRQINVTYRHSRQLNELARRIALLSTADAPIVKLPKDVDNDGVNPVLGTGLRDTDAIAEWLSNRIAEIEKLTGSLPSLAVLVREEALVIPVAEALNTALVDTNVRAVACSRGQSVGQENDVRVFDVQHIKGLEFEGVFFVGIDHLAEQEPDLFDKYLFVGTTRAAYYLGVTVDGPALPSKIEALADCFQESWP